MARTIRAVDLFCGAGGSSTGLAEACAAAGAKLELLAVNHWEVAIATHTTNHPSQRHMCASINALDPKTVAPGKIDLLWASPECTHHSVARGLAMGFPEGYQFTGNREQKVKQIGNAVEKYVAKALGAAALRESEWLPIEGAPKDGSEVDVWTSEGRETDAVYKDGCWRVWGMGGFDQMGYVRMAYQPTHYRPLPSPPKEQSNG